MRLKKIEDKSCTYSVMLRAWLARHRTWILLPTCIVILALFLTSQPPLACNLPPFLAKIKNYSSSAYSSLSKTQSLKPTQPSPKMPKAPVYFLSHGGASLPSQPHTPLHPANSLLA